MQDLNVVGRDFNIRSFRNRRRLDFYSDFGLWYLRSAKQRKSLNDLENLKFEVIFFGYYTANSNKVDINNSQMANVQYA